MSGTALDHPLVRDYLRDLDTAFALLPTEQARELREQITAHLDDALRPDADDQEVAAVLRRMGAPADLAAEASPPAVPHPAARIVARGLRSLLARWAGLGWRGRALVAAAVVLAGIVIGYTALPAITAPIEFAGESSWWYARDSARETDAYPLDGQQTTAVPIRSGQRQGFVITVDNPSDWTQTVLGPGAGFFSPNGLNAQISVATADPYHGGGVFRPLSYALPESIPPHQTRALRVLWTSSTCLSKGAAQGIDQISLRVRAGWITRTELVPLYMGFFLTGPSTSGCT